MFDFKRHVTGQMAERHLASHLTRPPDDAAALWRQRKLPSMLLMILSYRRGVTGRFCRLGFIYTIRGWHPLAGLNRNVRNCRDRLGTCTQVLEPSRNLRISQEQLGKYLALITITWAVRTFGAHNSNMGGAYFPSSRPSCSREFPAGLRHLRIVKWGVFGRCRCLWPATFRVNEYTFVRTKYWKF